MSVSLSTSKDIIANSLSLINSDGTVTDIKDTIGQIEGGLTSEQIQAISDISTALNNDPNFFTTIQNQINNKQNILDNYLPSPISNLFLYNDTYIRTIRVRTGLTSFLETNPSSDNYNNYEINIDTNVNNLQNYHNKTYINSIVENSGNINFIKIPNSSGAVNVLNSAADNAVMAIGDTAVYNYKPANLKRS